MKAPQPNPQNTMNNQIHRGRREKVMEPFPNDKDSGDSWMYHDPNVPRHGKSLYQPYITWVFMGKLSPRIQSLNTINTMVVHVRERGPHPSKRPLKESYNNPQLHTTTPASATAPAGTMRWKNRSVEQHKVSDKTEVFSESSQLETKHIFDKYTSSK